jgi:hypothetical protein
MENNISQEAKDIIEEIIVGCVGLIISIIFKKL